MPAEIRNFMDPREMAERRSVVAARYEGWAEGRRAGFHDGLAWGIVITVVLYATISAVF